MAEYVIRIINDTQKEQKRAIANSSGGGEDNSPKQDNDSTSKKIAKTYVAYKKYIAPFVSSAISHQIGVVALSTGRVEEQQKLQFAYSVGTRVFNIVEDVALGAALGGAGGAVVGGVMSGLKMAVSFVNRVDTISRERTLENITLGLQNVRAGGSVAAYNGSRG